MSGGILTCFAGALEYPGQHYQARLEACAALWDSAELNAFRREVAGLSGEEMQELFTQTFDWNPDTSLDLGWHLFGENYDRGGFLIRLRGELRRYGLTESGELPDHLTSVLRLLERIPAAEATPFARDFVVPALGKIATGLEKSSSPFLHLIKALEQIVAGQCWLPALTEAPNG